MPLAEIEELLIQVVFKRGEGEMEVRIVHLKDLSCKPSPLNVSPHRTLNKARNQSHHKEGAQRGERHEDLTTESAEKSKLEQINIILRTWQIQGTDLELCFLSG